MEIPGNLILVIFGASGDLTSRKLHDLINEDQIYRIDHYLGKETVQNLLVTRFANGIFEPLWNRNYIHLVEITSAESIGVEGRGGYYDSSGALRDMVQNHLLQMVGLTAMEPPSSLEPDSIRNEVLKVFQSLQPIRELDVAKQVIWSHVHFFWGDERCVAPGDPDSNYGMARNILLDKINIPDRNIHRIRGEDDPVKEALRYSDEIKSFTRSENLLPSFDIMILGLGDDGHTASIFPGNLESFNSQNICDVAVHPVSGQKRITVTGKVINNSSRIFFVVAGERKALVIESVFKEKAEAVHYPVSYIHPTSGDALWMLDAKAAGLIR